LDVIAEGRAVMEVGSQWGVSRRTVHEGKIRMTVRHINRTRLATDQPKVFTPTRPANPGGCG